MAFGHLEEDHSYIEYEAGDSSQVCSELLMEYQAEPMDELLLKTQIPFPRDGSSVEWTKQTSPAVSSAAKPDGSDLLD